MMDLHLNVNAKYYNQYKAGEKRYEYRLYNEYWKKRLKGKTYNNIYYKSGYPRRDDPEKISVIPYQGYEIQTRTHKHFGDKPVKVFAIKLGEGK